MTLLMQRERQQQALRSTPPRGRTAITCSRDDVPSILSEFGATLVPIEPCGVEVKGINLTERLDPKLVGALESVMADHGFVLFREQGTMQNEMGIEGKYLTGEQQCEFSLSFGKGALHSTHGNHAECPNRDIFRLSNDTRHGFNEVGPEWHNDGSFERNVFGHVVYHIIKAPQGPGNTAFAHLGKAYDSLTPERRQRYAACASVNSNSGVVHPLVHNHPISGRASLYLHTGMTGAILERVAEPSTDGELDGVRAWKEQEVNELMCDFSALLDRPDISYNHKWAEGDVIVIDNLAVAHKAMPGAHKADSGLRILHRTTCLGSAALDPKPELRLPKAMDTTRPCPFKEADVVWVDGYVGFRWGDWRTRTVPH
eukprot:TRINITY_DN7465_c0_g2_i1.p1 TRINITY_DN7465_c0_g2~~TRINITY_DN7465_c0_g2_i1.p1  ORF type:complete len:370 (+),score=58.73 TRINITY_DN7465_c0_g2_i1:120-1229(+)